MYTAGKKAEMLCEEFENKYGIEGIAVGADLSKEKDVREPAEKALARFGKVDVLVNNAGIALYSEVAHKISVLFPAGIYH